jgi:hypothetical protein
MNRKTKIFTVIGKMSFPIDMLRYDACYPSDQESAETIRRSISEPNFELKTVHLVSQQAPTPDRWESFCWHFGTYIKE